MEPESRAVLPALAAVGNAVVLGLLLLFLLQAPLFLLTPAGEGAVPPASPRAAPPLLFILCDGLRRDAAEDARLMPALARLGARGQRATLRVESLIPSTIAGVRAEIEGLTLPPAGFVFDFASPSAPGAGFLQQARAARLPTFAAGPRLWADLYGAWLSESVTTTAADGEDERMLAAGLERLSRPGWGVAIVHLSRPDVAAHLSGGTSPRYRAAAAWCDAAVQQLAAAAGPEATVVVTTDHGITGRGGHAGAEPEVVLIPMVVAGPGAPPLPATLRQSEVSSWLQRALDPARPVAAPPLPPAQGGGGRFPGPALLILLAAGALVVGEHHLPLSRRGFWLNAVVWLLPAGAYFSPVAALGVGLAVLLLLTFRPARPRPAWPLLGALTGLLLAGVRWQSQPRPAPPLFLALALPSGAVLLLGLLLQRGLRARSHPAGLFFAWGAAGPLLAALAGLLCGESLSLSSLDVRAAFLAAARPSSWAGAAVLAAVQPFLPEALWLSLAAPLLRHGPPSAPVWLAEGFGLVLLGEALLGVLAFSAGAEQAAASLALALWLRLLAEALLLFPLLAGWAWWAGRARRGKS